MKLVERLKRLEEKTEKKRKKIEEKYERKKKEKPHKAEKYEKKKQKKLEKLEKKKQKKQRTYEKKYGGKTPFDTGGLLSRIGGIFGGKKQQTKQGKQDKKQIKKVKTKPVTQKKKKPVANLSGVDWLGKPPAPFFEEAEKRRRARKKPEAEKIDWVR